MATGSHTKHNMTEDDFRHMAGRLVELRRRHKLRQTEAVTKLGVKPNGEYFSPTYWGSIEHHKLCMSRLFHDMCCNAFNVTSEWLLGEGKTRDDLPKGIPNAHSFHKKNGNGHTATSAPHSAPGYIAPRGHDDNGREADEMETTGERIRRENAEETPPAPPVQPVENRVTIEVPVWLNYNAEAHALTVTVASDLKVYVRKLGTPTIVKGS